MAIYATISIKLQESYLKIFHHLLINDVLQDCRSGSNRRKATPHWRGLCQPGKQEENIRRSVRGARDTRAVYLGGKVCPLSGFHL